MILQCYQANQDLGIDWSGQFEVKTENKTFSTSIFPFLQTDHLTDQLKGKSKNNTITRELIPWQKSISWLYVYWKHTLETLSFGNIILDWKHGKDIGNINRILETYKGYWKQNQDIGNIQIRLETYSEILETMHLET